MSYSADEGDPSELDKQDVFDDLFAGSEYVLTPFWYVCFTKYLGTAHCNLIWWNQDGYAHQYTHFWTLLVFFMQVFLRKSRKIWMMTTTTSK